jgi:hypothetical protein
VLAPGPALQSGNVGMNRKGEELPFRGSPEPSRYSGIQKPNHRCQHFIRSEAIPAMNPEDSPVEAQHDGVIRVSEDPLNVLETQSLQPLRKTIFEKEVLTCVPAYPLTR